MHPNRSARHSLLLLILFAPSALCAQPPAVGNKHVVTLKRKATSNGKRLEFLSVTLFPGRGMNLFQITANVPGKGEIPILTSPSVEQAAALMTGTGKDEWGNVSHTFGGAFLIPYANVTTGPASSDGKTLHVIWRGKTLNLPANWQGKLPDSPKRGLHGLILDMPADEEHVQSVTDGQADTAVLHAGNFRGHWLSSTDLKFEITLTGKAVDVTITATNTGKEPEPMAIGWHPYFSVPSGDRKQARLHLAAAHMMEAHDAIPTGRMLPVEGTNFDFNAPQGVPLGTVDYNNNFSHFQRNNRGIDAIMTDPASNYGIHVESLSPEIQTVQIFAPLARPFVAIEPQFNFPDPFGAEWNGADAGMVPLPPGKSVSWKVRLELFAPNSEKH